MRQLPGTLRRMRQLRGTRRQMLEEVGWLHDALARRLARWPWVSTSRHGGVGPSSSPAGHCSALGVFTGGGVVTSRWAQHPDAVRALMTVHFSKPARY
jgi:hypothetical protein